ncbi:MAG TPA: DNA mismatch repair endonuclease MutL [Aquifex aeolicus]|nr:DNA mismatch repair endonuclease MutL [Aquifex aeolicus]
MFVKVLPPNVRSKIAAGEVIESPVDVVKELVENSLDAGATRVDVEIAKGGKRLIWVRDNGTGVHPEDIDKVFLEGATSKIESEQDLMSLSSYGFRGEALHSIVSVSRFRMRSRFFGEGAGWEVELEGGTLLSKRMVGMATGTEVEVRDLFFNLPARRSFLKREDTERNRIVELLKTYALAKPQVSFSLLSNGKELLFVRSSKERERVEEVLGGYVEEVGGEKEFLKVRVFLRRNVPKGKFYLFVNSRPVSSKALVEFLRKKFGYKTLCAVFMELPPFFIDFNVHPKKKEIKFLKERKTLALLEGILSREGDLPVPGIAQEVPSYGAAFKVLGQVKDTLIVAQRGDYLYFFDQHLLSERLNYESMGPGDEDLACRVSLKAGRTLTRREMEELLKRWETLHNPHVCPHGRPIYYRIHLREIYDKLGRSL